MRATQNFGVHSGKDRAADLDLKRARGRERERGGERERRRREREEERKREKERETLTGSIAKGIRSGYLFAKGDSWCVGRTHFGHSQDLTFGKGNEN